MSCESKQNLNLSANRRRNFNRFNLGRSSILVAFGNTIKQKHPTQNLHIFSHLKCWTPWNVNEYADESIKLHFAERVDLLISVHAAK